MFSDRAWGLKFAAALAAVAAFGVLAYDRGRFLDPSYGDCLIRPDTFDGAVAFVSGTVVGPGRPDGALVRWDNFDILVRGRIDAAPGTAVHLRGAFRKADGALDLVAWRPVGPLARWRWLVEVASLLVFAVVAWNFLRHFAFRRERLEVEVGS